MALAFDAASGASIVNGTSITLSHTCTGSSRLLIAAVRDDSGSDTLTGVTYAGVAMTQIAKINHTAASVWLYMYYLVAPATGANNIVASFSGGAANHQLAGSSYTGASGTQPDASNTREVNESGNSVVTVTVVASNCWLVGTHSSASSQPGSIVNGVLRSSAIANTDIFDSNATVGTGAQTIGGNWGSADDHAFIGASIAPGTQPGDVLVFGGYSSFM